VADWKARICKNRKALSPLTLVFAMSAFWKGVELERLNKGTQLTATPLLLMRMMSPIRPLLLMLRLRSDDPYLRSGPRFARQ
jgi:hypothetical protein